VSVTTYNATAGNGTLTPPCDTVAGVPYPLVKLDTGAVGAAAGPICSTNPMPSQGGGATTASVPTGAANTIVKNAPGRLCRVLVTTAGTGSGSVLIYDNASTNSGTVIGVIPATIVIGTFYTFDMPAANGITVANVANGPVLTVSYY
jgi:hypothetical protein